MARLSDRTFGLALAVIFSIIFCVGWLFFDSILLWLIVVAAFFGLTGLTVPWLLLPLNHLWHALAHPLGQLMNYVVLGIFYYAFVVPIGLALRLFGWDPMRRAQPAQESSGWTDVQRHTDANTLRDMF